MLLSRGGLPLLVFSLRQAPSCWWFGSIADCLKATKVLAAVVDAEQAVRVAEERTLTSEFRPSGQMCALYQDRYVWSWAQSQLPALEAVLGEAGRGAV